MIHHTPVLTLCLIGVVAGLMSGMFGIGGGLIMVPALVYIAGFSQLSANGTSLAVLMLPVGFAAVIEYYRNGNVDIRAAAIIAVCILVSAWISAHFANRINPAYLRLGFGIFIVFVGAYITLTSMMKLK